MSEKSKIRKVILESGIAVKPAFCLALFVLGVFSLAACRPTPARTPTTASTRAASATLTPTALLPPTQTATPATPLTRFGFGVEYGNLDLGRADASLYATFGARWVKFTDITWGAIVPRPGLKACQDYSWGKLDGWVKEWQAAGFQIQMVLRSKSSWATQPPYRKDIQGGLFGGASTPPKPDQWEAYGDFVRCVVERYDADGMDDMPGLRLPILDYEIESEVGVEMFWQGTAEEYLRLLKLAYERVKVANPRARVIASGLGIPELFDDGAGPEVWTLRMNEWRARNANNKDMLRFFDRVQEFIDLVVQHPEAFDVVEGHWLTDYKSIFGGVAWIRGEMAKRGYQKPVWAGDATSAMNLMVAPAFFEDKPFKPLDLLRLRGILGVGGILNNPNDAAYPATERWFRAEQARLTVKKLVTGMAVKLEGINLCCLQDWPAISFFPYQGLIDGKQQPRPALYSYGLVTRKLAGYSDVKRLALGKNIYAYQFIVRNKPITVLWYDDGKYYLPTEEPSIQVDLPLDGTQARITRIITETGQTEPKVEIVALSSGRVRLPLNGEPILVESGE